jgi:hypothetical protein
VKVCRACGRGHRKYALPRLFRQQKTKTTSNQAFSRLGNIGLYQISLFSRDIGKVTAMPKPNFAANTDFRRQKTKAASNQAATGSRNDHLY